MALSIFLLGMASLLALFATATLSHRRSLDWTNTTFLLHNLKEEVKLQLREKLRKRKNSQGFLLLRQKLANYPGYEYDVYVHPLPSPWEGYWVALSLHWREGAKQIHTSFGFILLQEDIEPIQRR